MTNRRRNPGFLQLEFPGTQAQSQPSRSPVQSTGANGGAAYLSIPTLRPPLRRPPCALLIQVSQECSNFAVQHPPTGAPSANRRKRGSRATQHCHTRAVTRHAPFLLLRSTDGGPVRQIQTTQTNPNAPQSEHPRILVEARVGLVVRAGVGGGHKRALLTCVAARAPQAAYAPAAAPSASGATPLGTALAD
eukprot:818499-Prorocentrum_minimum.AAC.1